MGTTDDEYTKPLNVNDSDACAFCGTICLAVKRIFLQGPLTINAEPWEEAELKKRGLTPKKHPVTTRYAIIRNSALICGNLFTFGFLIINVYDVIDILVEWADDGGSKDSSQKAAFWSFLITVGILGISMITGCFLATKASRCWTDIYRSRRYVRRCYFCIALPLFLIECFWNVSSVIDWDEMFAEVCQEVMSAAEEEMQAFSKEFNISGIEEFSLPSDICKRPMNEWEGILDNTLQKSGIVSTSGEARHCPRAKSLAQSLQVAEEQPLNEMADWCNGDCHTCKGCTGIYTYYLSCLALNKTNPGAMASCNKSSETMRGCWPCFQDIWPPIVPYNCIDACLGSDESNLAEFAAQSFGYGTITPCLKPSEADAMLEATRQIGKLKLVTILGNNLKQAVLSAVTTLPLAIAQVMGMQRALVMAKVLVPEARLPGILLGSAVVFPALFLLSTLGFLMQAVGNYMMTVAWLIFLAGFFMLLPVGDLDHSGEDAHNDEGIIGAQSETAAAREMKCRSRLRLAFFALTLIALGVWLQVSELRKTAWDSMTDKERNKLEDALFKKVPITVCKTVCSTFGVSLIALVFYLDAVVQFLLLERAGELRDAQDKTLEASYNKRLHQLAVFTGAEEYLEVETPLEGQKEVDSGQEKQVVLGKQQEPQEDTFV